MGAMFWAVAVAVQAGVLMGMRHSEDAKGVMVLACAAGVGVSLLVVAPVVLWRPFRLSATVVPLALLALVPLALFVPVWVVDGLATPVMLGAVGFLYVSGLLIRPIDRRAWRRWRGRPEVGAVELLQE